MFYTSSSECVTAAKTVSSMLRQLAVQKHPKLDPRCVAQSVWLRMSCADFTVIDRMPSRHRQFGLPGPVLLRAIRLRMQGRPLGVNDCSPQSPVSCPGRMYCDRLNHNLTRNRVSRQANKPSIVGIRRQRPDFPTILFFVALGRRRGASAWWGCGTSSHELSSHSSRLDGRGQLSRKP